MWIKICGVTNLENARDVAALKPSAIGLNFYQKSPRSVDVETARQIVQSLPNDVQPVGVFVNEAVSNVREICSQTGIRIVQLHGDEPIEVVQELSASFEVIRAFRVDESGLGEVAKTLESLEESSVELKACLIDARVGNQYGGSGHTAPWDLLRAEYQFDSWPPLLLAGGITPANVADAIEQVQPWGVDTASGVESNPGMKDVDKVRELIRSAGM